MTVNPGYSFKWDEDAEKWALTQIASGRVFLMGVGDAARFSQAVIKREIRVNREYQDSMDRARNEGMK